MRSGATDILPVHCWPVNRAASMALCGSPRDDAAWDGWLDFVEEDSKEGERERKVWADRVKKHFVASIYLRCIKSFGLCPANHVDVEISVASRKYMSFELRFGGDSAGKFLVKKKVLRNDRGWKDSVMCRLFDLAAVFFGMYVGEKRKRNLLRGCL